MTNSDLAAEIEDCRVKRLRGDLYNMRYDVAGDAELETLWAAAFDDIENAIAAASNAAPGDGGVQIAFVPWANT